MLRLMIILPGLLLTGNMLQAQTLPATEIRPIEIEVTTHLGDKQTFFEGDVISFLLSLDRDAYLLVIYQDAAGKLIQILPNRDSGKGFYPAGLFISLPDKKAPFRFRVQSPFGEEILWAFALDKPAPELKGRELQNGLKVLNIDIHALGKKLRATAQTAFGETQLVIHTRPR